MALGKIKSCGWELEHSAKIAMQSEALICAAMAPYPKGGQAHASLGVDVFGCNI